MSVKQNDIRTASIHDKVILAPMVRGSELAFRMLVRTHGGVTTPCSSPMLRATEVIQALDVLSSSEYSKPQSSLHEDAQLVLYDVLVDTEPLVVQLCGNAPDTLYTATRKLLEHSSTIVGVDLNLGCPKRTAQKLQMGAFLAEDDPDLAAKCVAAMRRAMDDACTATDCHNEDKNDHRYNDSNKSYNSDELTPKTRSQPRLSCKIRLRENLQDTIRFVKDLEQAGCDVITVHCRRLEETRCEPDYEAGAALVQAVSIPIVINGNGFTKLDIQTILDETKASAVMVARGFLQNPFLLLSAAETNPDNQEVDGKMRAHLSLLNHRYPTSISVVTASATYVDMCEQYPPPSPLYIRQHLRWMFREHLQPQHQYPTDYRTNWRTRLWTFLARPYLDTMSQFRQVIALYVQYQQHEENLIFPACSIPESIAAVLGSGVVTFQTIRHRDDCADNMHQRFQNESLFREEELRDCDGLAVGLFG